MGQTCSTCKPSSSPMTQIVHIQTPKPRPRADSPSIVNRQKQLMSELLSNTSSKLGKNRQSINQHYFQIKYTTSSFGDYKNVPTLDMADPKKMKTLQKSSVGTLVLQQLKGNYLEGLFQVAQEKVIRDEQGSENKSKYELTITPCEQKSSGSQMKRTFSNKSQSNKIERQMFIRISKQNINQKYVYTSKIGEGGFGFVYKGYNKITKEERAIKIIKKKRLTQKGGQQALFAELEILREIDHPNIIKLYDVFEYRNTFYVITQYCDGGQLFEAVKRAKHFTEGHVAHIMTQILSAVNYLEKKGIVHRDLKPENIVLEFKSTEDCLKEPPIKIIDFGTATYCKPGQILRTQVGSPYYIAPEVIKQEYNSKCDIWSAGVIMYVLLCGYPPFRGRVQKDIFEAILKGKLVMEGGIWDKISKGAKDLLKQMLQPRVHKRINAEQALKHEWMTQFQSNNLIEAEVLNNMEKFFFKNKFLAVIETFLAMKTISQEDRRSLTDKFRELDKDNSGVLEIEQVIEAYKSIYVDTDEEDVKRILLNIDTDHSGHIQLTEFIVATIQQQKLYKKQALENAWDFFDKDKTGYLDLDELGEIIGGSDTNELKDIMTSLGAEGDQISKQRFMRMFQSKTKH